MKKSPGIRMIEAWFAGFGVLILFVSLWKGMFESNAWMGLYVSGVFFLLFGVTLFIDLKTRRFGSDHWAQAVPERFRASHAVWYFFVSVGPILLAALIAALLEESSGVRVAAVGGIVLLVGAFCVFAAIDRAVVMRRKRREVSGELPKKKTRLIHIIQGFFVLIGLTGFLMTLIEPGSKSPLFGILIGVGGFAAFLVCWLIERKIQPKKDFKLRWVHGVYGYCIPFGIFSLLAYLGAFIAKSMSAAKTSRGSGIEDDPHLLLLVPGFCFALIAITYIIDHLNIRVSKKTRKRIKTLAPILLFVIGVSFFLHFYLGALSMLDDPTMEELIDKLEREEVIFRESAARDLGEMGDERAVTPLVGVLEDESQEVRLEAVVALGRIGSREAVRALLDMLNDSDSGVRSAAAVSLADIGDKSVTPHLRELLENDSDANVRICAAYGLVKLAEDDRAFLFLLGSRNHTNWAVRNDAVELLDRIGDKRAVDPLIAMLRDSNNEVRVSAVKALGKLKDERAVTSLIETLSDDYWLARSCAAKALGEIGDNRAIEPLLKELTTGDQYIRRSAAEALGKMDVKRAVEPIITLLSSEEWIDKYKAAESLAAIGDKRAVEPLINALKVKDDTARCYVAAALGDLGDNRAAAALRQVWKNDEEKAARIGAAYGLFKITGDKEAFDYLLAVLGEKKTFQCYLAAILIGKTGDKRAIEPLIDAMKDGGQSCHYFSAESLKQITGQDFGGSYAKWKAWFEKNKDK